MEISDYELAWLAGLLEGEGSFMLDRNHQAGRVHRYPKIVVGMTDRDVIEHAARLFGTGVYNVPPDPRRPHGKAAYRTHVTGRRAAELMRAMLPWLGERRSAKIVSILEEYEAQEPTRLRRRRTCSEAAAGRSRGENGRFVA